MVNERWARRRWCAIETWACSSRVHMHDLCLELAPDIDQGFGTRVRRAQGRALSGAGRVRSRGCYRSLSLTTWPAAMPNEYTSACRVESTNSQCASSSSLLRHQSSRVRVRVSDYSLTKWSWWGKIAPNQPPLSVSCQIFFYMYSSHERKKTSLSFLY